MKRNLDREGALRLAVVRYAALYSIIRKRRAQPTASESREIDGYLDEALAAIYRAFKPQPKASAEL